MLDLAGTTDARPYEIAAHLAYGLSEKVRQFGELKFPRLLLGLVVVGSNIDQHNRPKARAELRNLLSNDQQLVDRVREVGKLLVDEVAGATGAGSILGLGLDGIAAARWSLRVLRGKAFSWYREGTGQRFDQPLDALIALHSWEVEGTPRAHADVDETLCAAFLADLRAAFSNGLAAWRRTGNCVALLDNADSPEGQAFLETLVAVRQAAHAREGCDPLLVVAAGHTRFPSFAHQDGQEPAPRRPQQASYADWAAGRDGTAESWLYPVRLDGVDARDRTVLVRRSPRATAVPDAVALAERLTGGHPAGMRLVLRAVAAQAARVDPHAVELRDVLDLPDPGRPERTVADAAQAMMLRGVPAALRRDLTTCAAAADVAAAARRHALGLAPGGGAGALDRFCATDLWVSQPDRSARPVLHPLLRRVLLHALAARPEDAPDGWRSVHTRLRGYYLGERDDEPAALYHGLALGDVTAVAAYLEPRQRTLDSRRWLVEVKAITRAPRLTRSPAPAPLDQAAELAGGRETLARLVAALWISNDPLGDPNGTLDVLIAASFDRLAPRSVNDDVIYDEANRYRSRNQHGSRM
ncbi:MAG TPA: hypothetical protein VFM54_15455 [Micromonosporaceae bacterium]|nr:hypothetical protein [Micromonosporaceae bacterium]